MALCMRCGTIYHDDDMFEGNHTCAPDDVPAKGEERRPQIIGKASVIASPDGTQWDVNVSDAGAVSATKRP